MGLTQKLGTIPLAIFTDASNNVGIGGSPSGSYTLDVTGTGRFTGGVLISGTITAGLSNGNIRLKGSTDGFLGVGETDGKLYLSDWNTATKGLVINLSTGNVGIGTSSPSAKLEITNGRVLLNNGYSYQFYNTAGSAVDTLQMFTDGNVYLDAKDSTGGNLIFRTSNSIVERMRITSSGYLKVSNNGTYGGVTSTAHEIVQSLSNYQIITNTHTGSTPYGIEVNFKNADPNNATNWMSGFYTESPSFVWIYRIFSNGTVSARSDARWKKNIETTRNGYLEDLCKLRIVKYNWYNHEEGAPKELGLIAQEVEEVFPNLVQYDKVTTKKQVQQEDGTFIEQQVEDGESRSIKTSVLPYMLLKALQEANAKIEELSAKVSALENKS